MNDYSVLSSRAIIGSLYERLEAKPDGMVAAKIGTKVSTDMETETYAMIGMVPKVREWKGPRLAQAMPAYKFQLSNRVFENSTEIDIEDKRRDKTGQIDIRLNEFGDTFNHHWDDLFFEEQLALMYTANHYDGVPYFSASHSSHKSGTQKNLLTASEYASLDVGTATLPTAVELSSAFNDAIHHFFNLKDDQARACNRTAKKFLILCPSSWGGAPRVAINQTFIAGGVSNPFNAGTEGLSVELIQDPNLPSQSKFTVWRLDAAYGGLILQEEVAPEMSVLGPDSEYATFHNKIFVGGKVIRAMGPGRWQSGVSATLS